MDILIVGFYEPETMAWYLERNLKKLGHEVSIFCYRSTFRRVGASHIVSKGFRHIPLLNMYYEKKTNKDLLKLVKKNRYDLVIFLKAESIFPDTILEVKKHSKKTINWYMDPISGLDKGYILNSIDKYDYFLTKDNFIKKRLNELGFNNVKFLLEAFDPEIYKPVEEIDDLKSDISLVGNIYPYRLKIIKSLHNKNVKIWGKLISVNKTEVEDIYQGNVAISDFKNKIFNSAKIILNTHNPNEVDGTNVRFFEICGSGAFQLSDTTLHTNKIFKNKKHVVYYENIEELNKLIEYYLENPKERKKIALTGYKKALKKHTYEQRIKELFKIIKI